MARIVRPDRPVPPAPPEPAPAVLSDAPSDITPAGTIKTKMPEGVDAQMAWDAVTKYDAIIRREAEPVGWPIERIRGTIVIESRGEPEAVQKNASNGWSYGLMQIVPYGVGWDGWHELVRQKAHLPDDNSTRSVIKALYDPDVNISVGVAILEQLFQQYGTLDRASSAFFLGNPNWDGADTVNGNTGDAYRRSLTGLITEQRGFAPVEPKPDVNLLDLVMGGPYSISQEFAAYGGPDLYGYGIGHGLDGSQHTGIDLAADPGTPLHTPIDGIVVCAGTGVGVGAHGSSCAAFNDYMGRKTGRVEVMTHDGEASLIFGHCSRSLVTVGQTVKIGDQVATVGGMYGWHCHLEARTWANGNYMIRDPREVFAGGTAPARYAERLDWLPKPSEWGSGAKVRVLVDGVKLLQRANKDAAEVASPFAAGDEFEAVAKAWSEDERAWYWITQKGTRIPEAGTELVA